MKNYTEMTKAELESELNLLQRSASSSVNREELQSQTDARELEQPLHELHVYQSKLEMQNQLREAHQQLEESHQRYVALYDFAPYGYLTFDEKGDIREINLTGATLLGHERSDLIGKSFVTFIAESAVAQFLEHLRRCQQGTEMVRLELTLNGESPRPVQLLSIPMRDEAQQRRFFRCTLIDISERKRAEAAVQESEQRFAGIINSAMDAIITTDAEQRIVLFNTAAEEIFRCSAQAAIGELLDRFIPLRFRRAHQHHIANFGQTQVTRRTMSTLGAIYGLRANGEEFPIEASISQIETHGQKHLTVILRDITRRKRYEERLQEQAAMLNQAQEAILVRDLDDGIRFWNQGAERLYGWNEVEVIGRPVSEVLYRGDSSQLDEATKIVVEKGDWVGEIRQITKDGRVLTIEAHWSLIRDEQGKPKSILAINNDITEKKKLEAQFLRAQRLESIGTLASGIAHDLNNVLSPVLMAVQLLQTRLTDNSSQRLLDVLQQNVMRGSEMVKQVLSFARGSSGDHLMIQPKQVIKEVTNILRETLPKNIEVKYFVSSEVFAISADPTQIHQVLMNLCINARDAMQATGGTLTIAVENKFVDEQLAGMIPDANAGQYVVISVADTGTGIASQMLEKIFDPFFTTKEVGRGTGLGLSTVHNIIKGHGGFVSVHSEVGRGTKFYLYLPTLETGQPIQSTLQPTDLPTGHGELILVVDDEKAIREITQGTLESFGYRVLTAADGTEAITLYAKYKEEIQVVLTDMMMPYLDGPAMIRSLQKINPAVEIIASSGLTEGEKSREAAALGVGTFLTKPYTAQVLLQTLAKILCANAQTRA